MPNITNRQKRKLFGLFIIVLVAIGIMQVLETDETIHEVKAELKANENNKPVFKITNIEKKVIDVYTKPREVEKPKPVKAIEPTLNSEISEKVKNKIKEIVELTYEKPEYLNTKGRDYERMSTGIYFFKLKDQKYFIVIDNIRNEGYTNVRIKESCCNPNSIEFEGDILNIIEEKSVYSFDYSYGNVLISTINDYKAFESNLYNALTLMQKKMIKKIPDTKKKLNILTTEKIK